MKWTEVHKKSKIRSWKWLAYPEKCAASKNKGFLRLLGRFEGVFGCRLFILLNSAAWHYLMHIFLLVILFIVQNSPIDLGLQGDYFKQTVTAVNEIWLFCQVKKRKKKKSISKRRGPFYLLVWYEGVLRKPKCLCKYHVTGNKWVDFCFSE